MSIISKQLSGFVFNGVALTLATASWKDNVRVIYGFNAGGSGYTSFKPGSTFNSLTQLQPDGVYIVDAATANFDIPGAVLATTGSPAALLVSKALLGFMYSDSTPLTLASAPWKNNLNVLYGFNSSGTGYTSFKPSSTFNSLTQLIKDAVYILDAASTGFSIPGGAVAAGPVAETGVVPLTTDMYEQNGQDTTNTYGSQRFALSTVSRKVSGATSIGVRQRVDVSTGQSFGVGYFIDGAYQGLVPQNTYGIADVTVPLPDTNEHTLTLMDAAKIRANDQGDEISLGTSLALVTHAAGTTTRLPARKSNNCVYVAGDSIAVGVNASMLTFSWVVLLRGLLSCDVLADGYGFRGMVPSFGTADGRQALLTRLQAAFTGRSGVLDFVLDLGTNDYAMNYGSSAQVVSCAQQLLASVHAWNPAVRCWVKTPVTRADTGVNGLGESFAAYQAALLGVQGGNAWVRIMDAAQWLTMADISADGVHPNDSGYQKIASHYRSELLEAPYVGP